MGRKLSLVTLIALGTAIAARGDLTLLVRMDQEVREAGTPPAAQVPALPPMAGVPVPETPPDVVEPAAQTMWIRVYMAENRWRRDAFDEDPRISAAEPRISLLWVLGPNGAGKTTLLAWEKRTATVMDDERLAAMGQTLQQLQQALEQMPADQVPPGFQLPAGMEQFVNPTPPLITVGLEGPLEQTTLLDLSCEKWKFDIETRDSVANGGWGHTREESWQLLTQDLDIPPCDRDPFRWEATAQAALWEQAYEHAVAGLDLPLGFPVKSYTIFRDLHTGQVLVRRGELVEYDQGTLAPTIFEVPGDFTTQGMGLPEADADPETPAAPN